MNMRFDPDELNAKSRPRCTRLDEELVRPILKRELHAGDIDVIRRLASRPLDFEARIPAMRRHPYPLFFWACPRCGKRLPSFQPITRTVVDTIAPCFVPSPRRGAVLTGTG
jgi:hypothetical protein